MTESGVWTDTTVRNMNISFMYEYWTALHVRT